MDLSGNLFGDTWLVAFAGIYAYALWQAIRRADWERLRDSAQLHVFLGGVVCLLVLWTLRTAVLPGFTWHLSAMLSMTLIFGWSLAVLGASLALLGLTLAGLNDWSGLLPTAVMQVLLPASLAWFVLVLVRSYLPKHFFVYIFVTAFLGGGVVAVFTAVGTVAVLYLAGYPYARLSESYLLFLPLMFFPEGVLNGWIMSILVGFRPDWVSSFSDREYIDGK